MAGRYSAVIRPRVAASLRYAPPVTEEHGDICLGQAVKNSGIQVYLHADEDNRQLGDRQNR